MLHRSEFSRVGGEGGPASDSTAVGQIRVGLTEPASLCNVLSMSASSPVARVDSLARGRIPRLPAVVAFFSMFCVFADVHRPPRIHYKFPSCPRHLPTSSFLLSSALLAFLA